jgi:hypothetical protein
MNVQELRNLQEAYLNVYKNEQSNEKEVEIASHYFCEMGLNEIGVEILIEELGVEEFVEFVYDISENYYLTEARAGRVRIEPVTAKGTPFKSGKPTGKSLERLRKKKEERKEAESSERPSGMKAALQRQDAMVSASKQQPKKKGLLDRVAGAVLKGIERHKAATSGMGAATKVTAGKVGNAARAFAKGFTEETDLYNIILSHLIDEGYADTEEAAECIMVNMSEEWRDDIVEKKYSFPLKPSELATVQRIRDRLDAEEKPQRPDSKKNSIPELPIQRTARKRNPDLKKVAYK